MRGGRECWDECSWSLSPSVKIRDLLPSMGKSSIVCDVGCVSSGTSSEDRNTVCTRPVTLMVQTHMQDHGHVTRSPRSEDTVKPTGRDAEKSPNS
jgi:hypothetical protein